MVKFKQIILFHCVFVSSLVNLNIELGNFLFFFDSNILLQYNEGIEDKSNWGNPNLQS